MNKSLIFLIIATSILVLSAVVICVSPIMNNIEVTYEIPSEGEKTWSPASWKNLNCKIIEDQEKADSVSLDDIQKFKRYKNICYRQKAMYGLEYSAFIINIILTFVCADLTLLHYLNIGKDFEKKTGLIGLISGIIGFILTLVYVCYSGYIFTNDAAYGIISTDPIQFFAYNKPKLYPNGALYKWEAYSSSSSSSSGKYITINENDKGDYANILLYKDLGEKQYNYMGDFFDTYFKNSDCNSCLSRNSKKGTCDYIFYTPERKVENKYIYDRWITALILSVIIVFSYIGLIIFGFLLFKNIEESSPTSEQTPIVYKK